MAERIPLQRAVAVIGDDSVAIRRSRAQLLAPLIQLALAGGAVALIVVFLEVLPLALLVVLLGVALLMGPIATLGLVYNVIGRSVLLEREKQSVRWQQGLLGLGLGTDELVPFWRIDHIAVEGDYEAELAGGERQDLVSWDVELVKDNGKRLEIGSVVARSNRTSRPWHEVADYLIEAGYRVYLVNPLLDEALGRRCYDSVSELPERADIVDVFRRVPEVPGVVDDAIEAGAGAIWLQLAIVDEQAAARARAAGLQVVMDRCTKIDHARMRAEAAGSELH